MNYSLLLHLKNIKYPYKIKLTVQIVSKVPRDIKKWQTFHGIIVLRRPITLIMKT